MNECPIPATHRRLEEVHRLWHRAAESYDDPTEFRISLNALIQALRNVTFVLQKEQRATEGFDEWYAPWQTLMKDDVAMSWSVGARNHVVKEGDLDVNSTAIAGVQASWDEPELVTFKVPPRTPTLAIVAALAKKDVPAEVRRQGLLCVERRWVVDDLPQHELLDVLAHCYEMLSWLVHAAHQRAGTAIETCDAGGERDAHEPVLPAGLPACMRNDAFRTVMLNLRTNEVVRLAPVTPPRDSTFDTKVREHYRHVKVEPPRSSDVIDLAQFYMQCARQVLTTDGYHLGMAILHRDGIQIGLMAAMPEDQQSKMLFMEQVAAEVQRLAATSVIFIADVWYLTDPAQLEPGRRAGESSARREALTVTAVTADGRCLELFSPYSRSGEDVIFEGDPTDGKGVPLFMRPVLHVWGLPVPSERAELERLGVDPILFTESRADSSDAP